MYKLKKLNENGVVGIVAAFLIVGLIVAVISVLQTVYVPKWMEEKESEHMNEVADQFAQLKYSIDTHMKMKETNTPISTSITLGSKELPYLLSVRAFGSLEILNDEFNLTVTRNDSSTYYYDLGTIKYTSYNSYFINQDFVFEFGGVILNQDDGNTVRIKPPFSIQVQENFTMNMNLIDVIPIGNKDNSYYGYGSAPIQTEFLSSEDTIFLNNVSNMSLQTSYPYSWSTFFNSSFLKAGLNHFGYGTNYTIEYVGDTVFIEFIEPLTVNLEITFIEIGAQITPGWIEQR